MPSTPMTPKPLSAERRAEIEACLAQYVTKLNLSAMLEDVCAAEAYWRKMFATLSLQVQGTSGTSGPRVSIAQASTPPEQSSRPESPSS